MTVRPSMHARDSSGKQVSLLNEEPLQQSYHSSPFSYSSYNAVNMRRSISNNSTPSNAASPTTPALMRSDSYDSQNTNDVHSPQTPHLLLASSRQNSLLSTASHKDQPQFDYRDRMQSFDEYQHGHYGMQPRSSYADSRHSSCSQVPPQVYDEELYHDGNVPERDPKRYNCRYRDTLGCDKTFTTSGHASRHSKIHTAEKAVPCTFPGCAKKFTRNDNMKQHLETHYKDRSSRSSATTRTGAKPPVLTMSAGIKKSGHAGSNRPPGQNASNTETSPIMDPALLSSTDRCPSVDSPPPVTFGSIPCGFQQPPACQPTSSDNRKSNPNSSLDTLAAIASWKSQNEV